MIYILQIQQILGCTKERAQAVFDEMCASGFHFSSASNRQFKLEVIASNQLVKA